MNKRCFDFFVALIGLLVLSPLLLLVLLLVWLQDRSSPFYIAPRVGLNGVTFKMLKIRSMVVGADSSQVDSTSSDDRRITIVGHFVRKFKLDEVLQLCNVILGHMSLVGPRPNVQREVVLYTEEEKKLLSVKPGITDFSSIVFADLGEILQGAQDPNIAYNQLVRPWKSRLGLFYIERACFSLDLRLIIFTILAVFSRKAALQKVSSLLQSLGAPQELCQVATRNEKLLPAVPPGASEVVRQRGCA